MKIQDLNILQIHVLTQEQFNQAYENGTLDETAIYLTPEQEILIDNTLTVEGVAAEAKAVGDKIATLEARIAVLENLINI